jgi:hypothetical protein
MDTESIQLPGISIAQDPWGPPPLPLEDSVLIIYSVARTPKPHKDAVVQAVRAYQRQDIREDRLPVPSRLVRTYPHVFEIPEGAGPGMALGTELIRDLRCCLGAIAFVDDLRPNVAYELGFFHGKGERVLLLTARPPGTSWRRLSDLAGSALARYNDDNLETLVHRYLDRMFTEMESVQRWPTYTLPTRANNLLGRDDVVELGGEHVEVREDGDFGRMACIDQWEHPLNIPINQTLCRDARFKIALRSPENSHYSVYFELAFHDSLNKSRQVWLGLSSWLQRGDYRNDERNLPADPANKQWRFITGTFTGLLRQGHLTSIENATLKRVRFRAGQPRRPLEPASAAAPGSRPPAGASPRTPIEIGYLEITGLQ